MQSKDQNNRKNMNRGLAFAYRVGDLGEKVMQSTLTRGQTGASIPKGKLQTGKWYRCPVPEGMSGDGSEYYFYIRKGQSRHLCLFFSGGGMAWNEYTAARPVTGVKLAAGMPNFYWNNLRPFTQIMNIRTGLTDLLNPLNPFRDWNFIVITYATGDLHIGNNHFPYTAEDGSSQVLHFHGHSNFLSVMERAREYFPSPDSLLIAGDSAGAFAVPALTEEIIENYYPGCGSITLFSDSGQLLYPHWKKTVRDVWKADERLWKSVRTPNITMDWYRQLYRKYEDSIRYLYASSTHDYLLSAYFNDITRKIYHTDEEVQDEFFCQLKEFMEEFKSLMPYAGIFLNHWKNLAIYPNLQGGTIHTAVRQASFFRKMPGGVSMAEWLHDATEGHIRDIGRHCLSDVNK